MTGPTRVLTDPAEADRAFAAGVASCNGEPMSGFMAERWKPPSLYWDGNEYTVPADWVQDPLHVLLDGIDRAPDIGDVDPDDGWVEFDFVVPGSDRDRTMSLLSALVEGGWLSVNVIASRGVDLDKFDEPTAPQDEEPDGSAG